MTGLAFISSINHCWNQERLDWNLVNTEGRPLESRERMTDRDQLGRSEKKSSSSLLASDCSCRVGHSSSLPETDNKSCDGLVWRRYCALALVLSTLSVLLCAVTWSQNVSAHRRLLLVEEQLKASLTVDDPQLDAKIQVLLENKLMLFSTNSNDPAGSGQTRSRTIRQVSSATTTPAECLCPPGNSSPSLLLFFNSAFTFLTTFHLASTLR